MYGLAISEEEQLLVETLHQFAESELRAAARDAERKRDTPDAVARALHQLGVTAPVPEPFGGQGVPNLATSLRIAEELAWGDPGLAHAALGAGQTAQLIAQCGTELQQRRFLPRFVAGPAPLRASVLLHEGFGRQPSELRTRAERRGGRWILRGEKVGVSNPDSAEVAVIVATRSDTGELGAFVIEGRPDGWVVARDDREHGKLGLEAAHTGTVRLEGVSLPEDALLGGTDAPGLARAIAGLRLAHAAALLGCARAAKEFAQRYANERVAFGRPIASFQGVAFPLADQDMAIDAARLELFDAAAAIQRSSDAAEIEERCRCAVGRCGEVALRATREGVQTLGGHGFIREYPVERWYRAAAALAALDFDPLAAPVDFL